MSLDDNTGNVFLVWKTLFASFSYFVQSPTLPHSKRTLTNHALSVVLASTVGKLLSKNETIYDTFSKYIETPHLDKFIDCLKSPTLIELNEELLDIILCRDNPEPIPFVILKIVFDQLSDVLDLKNWSIIEHDLSDEIHYQRMVDHLKKNESIRSLTKDLGPGKEYTIYQSLLYMLRQDMVRDYNRKRTLSLLMSELNTPKKHPSIKFSKHEDDDLVRIQFSSDKIRLDHVFIDNIYPYDEDTFLDHVMDREKEDELRIANNETYLSNTPSSQNHVFRVSVGEKYGDYVFLCKNTFIVMVQDINDIETSISHGVINIEIKK